MNKLVTDTRFVSDSIQIDDDYHLFDWDVKVENRVSNYLYSLPKYILDIGLNPSLTTQTHGNHELKFSWRNTIPWRLECEE